jgi:hypothetical protein
LCLCERETHDPFYTNVSEDRYFGSDLPDLATVRSAAVAGILAFWILSDEKPVDICGFGVSEW